jgi:hypothetical protein
MAKQHAGGVMLDVGSSAGIYSLIVPFANPQIEVIALKYDLPRASPKYVAFANWLKVRLRETSAANC